MGDAPFRVGVIGTSWWADLEHLPGMRARRERYGISYVVVRDQVMEEFAPVVARLAGT